MKIEIKMINEIKNVKIIDVDGELLIECEINENILDVINLDENKFENENMLDELCDYIFFNV